MSVPVMPPRRLAVGAACAAMVVAGSVVLGVTAGSPTSAGAPVEAGQTVGSTASATGNLVETGAQSTFLIPHADGYGVADCLTGQAECGRIVANAWCESKGFRTASAYGVTQASDITGSIGGRAQRNPEPPLFITCKR